MKPLLLLCLLLFGNLYAFDDEKSNNNDPGELITALDNLSDSATFSASGALTSWDWYDAYHFKAEVNGTYTITLTSTQALDMKAGTTYGKQEFYRNDNDQNSKVNQINVKANQDIYLMIFDGNWNWKTRDYTLKINFVPEKRARLSIADANITEGDDGTQQLSFTLSVDKPDTQNDIKVDFTTLQNSAEDETGNNDFFHKSATVTIPKGSSSTTIDIDIDGDFQDESDETFYVILSNPVNAILQDANATGTIFDDDTYDNTNHYSCETQAYIYTSVQVYQNGKWFFDTPTDVRLIDLVTAEDRLVKQAFYPVNINAIGYSVGDNFIWGYDPHNNRVTRTDIYNQVISYTIDGLPKYMYHIGDVSPSGILYLGSAYLKTVDGVESNGIKRMYRVDVNPNSHKFRKVLPSIDLSEQNLYSADWAFHPIDEQLYMVNRYDYNLIKVDPDTGKVTHMGNLLPYNYRDQGSHVQFFDRDGYFYFYASGDFYRVDITDPNHPSLKVKKYTHLPLNSNGDAARCAYAPMRNSFHVNSLITQKEGDSGSSQIPVEITLDSPAGAGGIQIDYETQARSATADTDYQPVKSSVTIEAGVSTTAIPITIYGDKEVEDNESFVITLFSPTLNLEENSTVVIVNDDAREITFNAVTSGSPFSNGKITTQIVNKNFILHISAYDQTTAAPVSDLNISKIDLVQSDGTFIKTLYNGTPLVTDTNGLTSVTLKIGKAYKSLSVKIYGNYDKKNYANQAKDSFAVRPDHFALSIPAVNKAGEPFTFNLRAEDINGHPATAYNEAIKSSFDINYTEQKASCQTGILDLSGVQFYNGHYTSDLTYSEVGLLDFNVTEIPGYEFAIVDQNDTNDVDRYITPVSLASIKFIPSELKILDWSVQIPATSFVYYANLEDLDEMAAELQVHLRIRDKNGNILKNYRSGCYANKTNLHIKLKTEGTLSQNDTLIWRDMTKANHDNSASPITVTGLPQNQELLFDVEADSFINGETTQRIRINFARDSRVAKEPLRLTIFDLNASDSDGLEDNLAKNISVDFYYGRLHATNNYGVGKQLKVNMFHEVYCKSCDRKSLFTIASGSESKDSIYWYIVKNPHDGVSTFSTIKGATYPYKDMHGITDPNIISSITVPMQNSDGMDYILFMVPNVPFKDRISYAPKPWLIYNPFKITTQHSFNIQLDPIEKTWAGRGKVGKTVDTNIETQRRNNMKLNW